MHKRSGKEEESEEGLKGGALREANFEVRIRFSGMHKLPRDRCIIQYNLVYMLHKLPRDRCIIQCFFIPRNVCSDWVAMPCLPRH